MSKPDITGLGEYKDADLIAALVDRGLLEKAQSKDIKAMSLRSVLSLINFRDIRDDQAGMYKEDTLTVRIYTDIKRWFELGVYDFLYETERDEYLEKMLNTDILDAPVSSIRPVTDVGILEIWIDTEE